MRGAPLIVNCPNLFVQIWLSSASLSQVAIKLYILMLNFVRCLIRNLSLILELPDSRLDGKFLVSGPVLYLSSLSIFIFQTDITVMGCPAFVSEA